MQNLDYFFHPQFSQKILWKDDLKIHLGAVGPHNKEQFKQGLKKLSTHSIRNRFLGLKKEFSEKELDYYTQFDGHSHYALGIETCSDPQEGIGVVRIVQNPLRPNEAELAITIIDAYHGQGFGKLLVYCAGLVALERNIEIINYSFLPQNDAIIKLMNKLGPSHPRSRSMDYVQNYIKSKDIQVEVIKSQLVPYLPGIDTFHLKT